MKLKKNLLILFVTVVTLFSFTGCSGESEKPVQVNVSNSENISGTSFGKDVFIEIGNGLHYDSTTRIVYIMFDSVGGYSYFSAYYAPNGFPYRYNPETNMFEEIEVN